MSMTPQPLVLQTDSLRQQLDQVIAFVQTALQHGEALHTIEGGIWDRFLQLGHQLLEQIFALCGNGDLGETVELPDGQTLHRLPELHRRRYVSVFGDFQLRRTVYGSREGQKIEFVPLDNRLLLPSSAFSFLLQDWDQALCVEEAFGQVQTTMARMLHLKQPVDSLEHMNQEMAQPATPFRLERPLPPPAEEGEIMVVGADGKGIVMRREPDDPAPAAHRTKGEKASKKRMATVGAVYSVDRYRRTPEEIVAALFRDQREKPKDRPQPQHKQVWASLPQDGTVSGMEAVFVWILWELARRNPGGAKETVYLSDGQESLWEALATHLNGRCTVGILDLLHVTPRLWQAAHVFFPEKSDAAEAFVRARLLRVLRGESALVVRGLRVMGRKRSLSAAKSQDIANGLCVLGAEPRADALPRIFGGGLSDCQRGD